MEKSEDILLDEDYDLLFEGVESFDFKIGDSTEQDIELILLNSEGHIKQHPTFGVSVKEMTNGRWTQTMKTKIKKNLELDGFIVNDIQFKDGQINIDAIR